MRQFSIPYVLGFTTAICLVCSLAVSVTAVALKERQDINVQLDKQRNVLAAAGLIEAGKTPNRDEVVELFKRIETRLLDLERGQLVPRGQEYSDPSTIDLNAAAKDPARSIPLERNAAQLARRPRYVPVYLIMEQGRPIKLVLPIWGKGLWSTLWGFIALRADTQTIVGLTYYQHGETPGLGGEVDNPAWKQLWAGKLACDDHFKEVRITVVKGKAESGNPHQVDGLSGATITSRGVAAMMRLWLGEQGYGPFLANFRKGTYEAQGS
jgi:Na+-transporting NADH:ubiquinone oxidoreductase subunit C